MCTYWVKSLLHYLPCVPVPVVGVESTSDADPRPLANEATEYSNRILEILSMPPIYNEHLGQALVNGFRLAWLAQAHAGD